MRGLQLLALKVLLFVREAIGVVLWLLVRMEFGAHATGIM